MGSKVLEQTDYRFKIYPRDKYGRRICDNCKKIRRINAYWSDTNKVLCKECSTSGNNALNFSVRNNHEDNIPESEELEKAYGGCHICYGKGYATSKAAYVSPHHHKWSRLEMVFCTCDRGKQLEKLIKDNQHQARVEIMDKFYLKLSNHFNLLQEEDRWPLVPIQQYRTDLLSEYTTGGQI